MRKLRILGFSVVETVVNASALIAWLVNPVIESPGDLVTGNKVLAYAIWIVGFYYEHVIAFNTSRDKPVLQDPDVD